MEAVVRIKHGENIIEFKESNYPVIVSLSRSDDDFKGFAISYSRFVEFIESEIDRKNEEAEQAIQAEQETLRKKD